MPPVLCDAARYPHQIVVAAEGAGGGVGIRRLAVIDEAHASKGRHLLLPVREPGEILDGGGNDGTRNAERQSHGGSGGGVLCIMLAWQRSGAAEIGDRPNAVADDRTDQPRRPRGWLPEMRVAFGKLPAILAQASSSMPIIAASPVCLAKIARFAAS